MRFDPHSYACDTQPLTRALDLALHLDFTEQVLSGEVTLTLDRPATGQLDLDSRDLTIETVHAGGAPVGFELGPRDPALGQRLRLALIGPEVTIRFRASPDASALQWLTASMTTGGRHPYVFTQCQAIHARSIFPCQDTPRARVTYRATLDIPRVLRGVMAAGFVSREESVDRAVERFEMPQPIPPYLFAFAVGDIVAHELGPRTRVYAEPERIAEAAYEFADVDAMMLKAEALFGPYDWERFDILVMPPSFPYGGMENPRLTFVTPTLLAGDRSLVNVVAHELAHSWTGNLVTNQTMNDFWLNEGFTTYAERRIVETIEGRPQATLQAALGKKELEAEIRRFGVDSPFTRLRTDLSGVDPDEVYSRIPYEKGYFFVCRLEEAVGRDRFDVFLRQYINRFRFQSIDSGRFVAFLRDHLPEACALVDVENWLSSTGLPSDCPSPSSERAVEIEALGRQGRASLGRTRRFSTLEWQIYLSALPAPLPHTEIEHFESELHLSQKKNAEIKSAWLTHLARAAYTPAYPAIAAWLREVGRMKYLRPIYGALIAAGARDMALETFQAARNHYHPVARAMVERMLGLGESP